MTTILPAILLILLPPAGPPTEVAGRRPILPVATCTDCGRPMGRSLNLRTGESSLACGWCGVRR